MLLTCIAHGPQCVPLVVRASREDDLAELANIRGSVSNALKEKEAALKAGSSSGPGANAGAETRACSQHLPA